MSDIEKGFIIPNLKFTGKFRVVKWAWKHRNIRVSWPLFKRNTGMIITANLGRYREVLRNISEGSEAFYSLLDESILNKLPEGLVNTYIKTSPYISESVNLVPVFLAYNCITDRRFVNWNTSYGALRMLYQGRKPIRLMFSTAIKYNFDFSVLFLRFVCRDDLIDRLTVGMTVSKFRRITIIVLASLGELFGEPYDKPIPNKPVLLMLAKNVNTRSLTSMQSETYGSPQNPMIFDLIIKDKVNLMLGKDSVPPIRDCVEVSLADLERTTVLQNRKVLRIRSQTKARRTRDSIKRILLF